MPEYGIDFAWAQIESPAIKKAGCTFVMRYLGGSARITDFERRNHHAAGLAVVLFVEQEADQAEKGYARGVQLAQMGNSEADSVGYPSDALLIYADDKNDPDVSQEIDCMRGVKSVGGRPSDMYSGGNVLAALVAAGLSPYGGVCVETWYRGHGEDPSVEQLANTRDPIHIPGVSDEQFDTDILYRPIPMWGPDGSTTGSTASAPVKPKEKESMIYVTPLYGGGAAAILALGGTIVQWWAAAPADLGYGIPMNAYQWNEGSGRHYDIKFIETQAVVRLCKANGMDVKDLFHSSA